MSDLLVFLVITLFGATIPCTLALVVWAVSRGRHRLRVRRLTAGHEVPEGWKVEVHEVRAGLGWVTLRPADGTSPVVLDYRLPHASPEQALAFGVQMIRSTDSLTRLPADTPTEPVTVIARSARFEVTAPGIGSTMASHEELPTTWVWTLWHYRLEQAREAARGAQPVTARRPPAGP